MSLVEMIKDGLAGKNLTELLAVAEAQPAAPHNLMIRARILERMGRFDEARKVAEDVLKLNPNHAVATTLAARAGDQIRILDDVQALLAEKKFAAAKEKLESSAFASGLRALLLARVFLGLNNTAAARNALERFMREQPNHADGKRVQKAIQSLESSYYAAPADVLAAEPGVYDSIAALVAAYDAAPSPDSAEATKAVASLRARTKDILKSPYHDQVFLAKASHLVSSPADVAGRNYNAHLITKSVEYGYITWPRRIRDYVQGKRILDVGCGFGAFGNGFLVCGAQTYTGVDPAMPLDSTRVKNKRIRAVADLGTTPLEIMKVCPDIHLHNGMFEDFAKKGSYDVVVMHNVTEHLLRIEDVFAKIAAMMADDTVFIFHHHNFYCWNGHHQAPAQPRQYDPENPSHRAVADWRHILIAPDVPETHYFKTGLNRIKLKAFEALVRKYFIVDVWQENNSNKETEDRLTPELFEQLRDFDPTLDRRELIVNAVYGVVRKKPVATEAAPAKTAAAKKKPAAAKPKSGAAKKAAPAKAKKAD